MMVVLVRSASHKRHLVHDLSRFGQQFAHVQASDVGADALILATDLLDRIGLHVKRIVVRKPTSKKDKDDRFGSGALRMRFRGQQFRERESERREGTDANEVPSRNTAAKPAAVFGKRDVEHSDRVL